MNLFQTSSSSIKPRNFDTMHSYIEESYDSSDDEMNDQDENGNSSLIFASLNGKEETVKTLIDQGAFVNQQNLNGETALYWACSQGYESIVDFLIENGANLNVCNIDGIYPLHVSSANGHCSIVSKLIQNGAYINSQDEDRDTALHYAVREGNKDVVELLVNKFNARIDIKNEDLESPIELAQCLEPSCLGYSEIVQILISKSSPSSSTSSTFM